jgi:hypothetical protein
LVRELIGSKPLIDITGGAITPKYTALFDGVDYFNISADKYRRTVGLLTVIRYMIYTRWVRENFTPTIGGNVKSNAEVSTGKQMGRTQRQRQAVGT